MKTRQKERGFYPGPPCVPVATPTDGSTSEPSPPAGARQKTFLHEWSFLNMEDITELNLRVLRRHNHNILSLIDKSSYCVVYTFDTVNESWTKAGYEGTLFIYSQRPHIVQTPQGEEQGGEYGFCVLNRLTLDNFWGEMNGGDIILDGRYIITRSLIGVFGLWLYEEHDTPRIYSVLRDLNESARRNATDALASQQDSREPASSQSINVSDLFAHLPSSSMLREADPTTQQLPSVDRLSQLFSHALSI